ncbi:glycerophosphodiester phosphodiesterase [Bacillus aquiflavi]|uniref:glycerophosphodiester phosphodiesterase n=1 Tax=Bacillus aquiflavi TaxID=2672567 RepID=UPI001CA9471C|nr:glycerophosphodiester phosphodiesterase [Bacillus aquiflavi]UAC47998.1 glycerophosphodiester phosphodiesterase [Bacillus aquiflavi]
MIETLIFAHRGSKGTHPENTSAAFKEAVRLGVDGIELDVHLTKDNELVVIHDETVDRTTNGSGYVKEMTLAEIKSLDAGSWFSSKFESETIPTLSEVLELLKDTKKILNIEIKNDLVHYEGIEAKVLAEIEKYSYKDRIIVSSFNHQSIAKIKKQDKEIETALLTMIELDDPVQYANKLGAAAIHVYEPVAFSNMTKNVMENNLPVRTFTINDEKKMKQLISNGISAIMTDYPEKAMAIRDLIK